MSRENIRAWYQIESGGSLEQAAAHLAGEQSSGTFTRLPGESEELLGRHGAEVVSVLETGESSSPSLPGAVPAKDGRYRQGVVAIDYPLENVGDSLIALHTMLAGNLFELSSFSGLKLMDFELPDSFIRTCPGPKFGIPGTRRASGVETGPLLGTIIKPSVGLSPRETAALCSEAVSAGIDFIKDDELIANPPYSPVQKRVQRVMEAIHEMDNRPNGGTLYAVNISDTPDGMKRHHDAVRAARGNCVMVNLLSTGLAGLLSLREYCEFPIHGHRNGWGALSRCPTLGFDYLAWHKFWKLAGVDHLHVNGLRNKFCEADDSVIASAKAVQSQIGSCPAAMPAFSSGQWVDQIEDTFRVLGNADLLYVCGGGIWAHPQGGSAGVAALRKAWDGVMNGQSLESMRDSIPEIRAAYETFGIERQS